MRPDSTWYAQGLRWIASLLQGAADYIDRPRPEPMPRHTSAEEILSEARARAMWHLHS